MKSDVNGQLLQRPITWRKSVILEQLVWYTIMEINTTGMGLRFC